MRSTLDPVPEIPKGGSYVVGIDTGQNSVGHAAIALDKEGNPVEILAIQSVIHDSGVDPDSNKTGETRLAVSGVARRNRRRIRTTKRRLREIDSLLTSQGWIKPAHEGDPRKIWFERALAASEYIEDEQERKRILYAVFSHIARHRGWRNPYQKLETLFLEEDYCPQPGYREVEGNVTRQGAEIPSDATIGQMIAAAISLPGPAPDLAEEDLKRWDNSGQLRIRSRSGGKEPGLLSGRQFQEDYAAEVRAICRTQRIDDDTCRKLIRTIFKQKEPGKAAIDRVGKDELQPDLPRVATAHPQFQRYRIAATLAALTVIGSNNSARRLTANERQKIAAYLAGDHQKDAPPEWSDVAEIIGVDVTDIRGIATPTGDPTMLVGHRPPTDITNDRIQQSTFTTLKKWWRTASSAAREDLINSHINYEDATDEVDDLLLSFTEKDLTKLDGINFPTGRGAYSADTCKKLADEILTTEKNLFEARRDIFDLPDDWTPTPDPLNTPVGHPAVDRTLKVTARFLAACRSQWGEPARITVEVARDGLVSEKAARQQRNLRAAHSINLKRRELVESGALPMGSRKSTFYRWEAIHRQAGKCLYCGTPISLDNSELDHIVPRSGPGSTNKKTNLAATCHRCNAAKGGRTYAMWIKQDQPSYSNSTRVKEFVRLHMDLDGNVREQNKFRREIVRNLSILNPEKAIDSRSIAPTATMATLLHTRLKGEFPSSKINVVSGVVTAEARRASGIGALPLVSLEGDDRRNKTRLDRRHHAIDAATVALIKPLTAQVLAERASLRSQIRTLGDSYRPNPSNPYSFYGNWKEYSGNTVEKKAAFNSWSGKVHILKNLLQSALIEDNIPVVQALRLSRTDGAAHADTIAPLIKRRVQCAFTPDEIDASATPAQWCALTRCADFDPVKGLPENKRRHITINGTHFGPEDEIEFFSGIGKKQNVIQPRAAIRVRHGWADVLKFHHLRIYCVPGKRKNTYYALRVFHNDLPSNGDLFKYELPPQSLSIRGAHPKLREALHKGTAEYLTWITQKDEIKVDATILNGAAKTLSEAASDPISHWVLVGFDPNNYLKLKPRYLSAEGILRKQNQNEISDIYSPELRTAIKAIFDQNGWRPSTDKLCHAGVTIIRHDSLGRIRVSSRSSLPGSVTIKD